MYERWFIPKIVIHISVQYHPDFAAFSHSFFTFRFQFLKIANTGNPNATLHSGLIKLYNYTARKLLFGGKNETILGKNSGAACCTIQCETGRPVKWIQFSNRAPKIPFFFIRLYGRICTTGFNLDTRRGRSRSFTFPRSTSEEQTITPCI